MAGIEFDKLSDEINKLLGEYGDTVFNLTEEGLDDAENILIAELENQSPKGEGNGNYAKCWKSKKKYKGRRYVGNTKTVNSKKQNNIPLSNILEYSQTRSRPHMKRAFDNVVNQMANAIVNKLK